MSPVIQKEGRSGTDKRADRSGAEVTGCRISNITNQPGKCSAEDPLSSQSSRAAGAARRFVDILGATVGLLIGLPLLAMAAISVRLESPGPAVFKQSRIGKYGVAFTLYKFRGMYVDARDRFPDMYLYRYTAAEVGDLKFHPEVDPRVTRVGRVLRRASIDELPNLWNVLRGDMSLVGPRPEIPEMLPYYGAAADIVLSVKPGLTSLAKVNGRDQLTFSETVRYDVEYVHTRSLALDAKILVRTAATLLKDGWVGQ